MVTPKKKENRGGARANSGPKKKERTISSAVKANILDAAERLKKKHKIPVEEAMLALIYDKKVQESVKASVFKTYLDAMVAKETLPPGEGATIKPAVLLPEMMDDPAFAVIEGGK